VWLQANRTMGIGLQLSAAISMEASAHASGYPEKSPCETVRFFSLFIE